MIGRFFGDLFSRFLEFFVGTFRVLFFSILFAGVVLGLGTLVQPMIGAIETTYNVTARTEIVSGRISPNFNPLRARLHMEDVLVCHGDVDFDFPENGGGEQASSEGCNTLNPPIRNFTGVLRPVPGTRFTVERVGRGAVRLTLGEAGQEEPAAELEPEDVTLDTIPLQAPAELIIGDLQERMGRGSAFALPLVAVEVEVGREVNLTTIGDNANLIEGQVAMLGEPLFWGNVFRVETVDLDYGDRFCIPVAHDNDNDPEQSLCEPPDGSSPEDLEGRPEFAGLVSIADPDVPGMLAVFRVRAEEAQISRLMARGYTLSTAWYDRLGGDPAFQIFAALLALIVSSGILAAVRKRRPGEGETPLPVNESPVLPRPAPKKPDAEKPEPKKPESTDKDE